MGTKCAPRRSLHNRNKYLLFSAPSLIIIGIIMIFPVCYSVYYSFFSYRLGGTAKFVGLENYIDILKDDNFQSALLFSFVYTVVTVFFQVVLGMGIAILMDNISKGRKLISVLIYLPYFISASVSGIIFRWLFISNWGLVAQALSSIGIASPSWFDSPVLSKIIVMIAEIWQNTPFAVIIFFAGLQSVSHDQLEAANLDGASPIRQFIHVKLPHLRHMLALVLVMRMMDAFRVYDRIAVMTQGGPGTATESVSLYAYKMAFTKLRVGKGCAAGVLILLIMVIPVFLLLKKMRSEEAD